MVGRLSRCVTGRRPRDVRTTLTDLDSQSSENRELSQGYVANQRRLCHLWRYGLQRGASVGTPWLQDEDMGQEEVPSLSICLSIYLSNLQQAGCPFENKVREIYFYKEVFRFVHWSSFIIFDHVLGWVYEMYATMSTQFLVSTTTYITWKSLENK